MKGHRNRANSMANKLNICRRAYRNLVTDYDTLKRGVLDTIEYVELWHKMISFDTPHSRRVARKVKALKKKCGGE